MIKQNVLTGSITEHLARLAIPSIGGMFAIVVFNLTDTYFVSKLGTDSLAAMGFTFPIIMIIGALSGGISLGAGSVLARAMGSGNVHKMHRIATDGIMLSIIAVLIISFLGILTVKPFFALMGAEDETLSQVVDYMTIWYAGAFVIVVPPVSDSCMRAMGDMVRPFFVMLTCALVNFILDPILIFGYFGLPEMGIKGAAIATIIARSFGMILSLSFVHFHYKLIDFKYDNIRELIDSWVSILTIGIPNVLVRLLPQIVRGIMTSLAATVAVGGTAVAAIAAGQRIESFATIVSMAVGVAIVPIIGQNYGAKQYDRVHKVRSLLNKIAILYGVLLFVIIFPFGEFLGTIFSEDIVVINYVGIYLKIVLIGSIGLNQYNWLSEAFNAVGKPKYSVLLNVIGTIVIILPLLNLGAYLGEFVGMLIGLSLGQILVGLLAVILTKKYLV
jgi:putative MATE family efflux protein